MNTKIKIYQLPTADPLCFRDFAFVMKKSKNKFPFEKYKLVWEGDLEVRCLDDVYEKFNWCSPRGYRGRSLSVSDLVTAERGTCSITYFCDSFGWKEVKR